MSRSALRHASRKAAVMALRIPPYVLIAAVAAAGALAVYGSGSTSSHAASSASSPARESAGDMPVDMAAPIDMATPELPPNHPAIGASPHGASPPASDEQPAIAWTAPKAWAVAPNPNAMRLATYRPAVTSREGREGREGGEGAEVSVARAGGAVEDNVQRWLAQFDAAGIEKRTTKDVHGVKIEIVEVTGTYQGNGMTPGAAASSQVGWTLVGAIVETSSSSYFFKLLGPASAVKSARPSFDAMLDGIKAL